MEVTAPGGESFTATFGEHAIRYGFHGKPNVAYRAAMQSFFWHPSGRLRTAQDAAARRPAAHAGQLPLDLHSEPGPFAGLRAAVDPQAAGRLEPSRRPTSAPFWPLRDGERFLLVFGPEDKLRALAEEALRAP